MSNKTALSLSLITLLAVGRVSPAADWFDDLLAMRTAAPEEKRAAAVPLPDFGTGQFTVAAWVRTKADGTIFAVTAPKGKWIRRGKAFFLRGGKPAFDIGWVGCANGRTKITDGRWHHVAVTGGSPLRFYVDGKPDGGGDLGTHPDPKGAVFKIGWTSTNFPGGDNHFRGGIDDLRIYGRVLDAGEIASLCEKGKASAASCDTCGDGDRQSAPAPAAGGTRAHLPLDGACGDTSGSLNHAVPRGKTTYAPGVHGAALQLDGKAHLVIRTAGGAPPDAALWRRLAKRHPGETAREQMARERADGIWGADWRTVGLPAVARRYAGAIDGPGGLAERAATLAAGVETAADLKAVRAVYLQSRRRREMLGLVADCDLDGFRGLLGDIYADGQAAAFTKRIDTLESTVLAWAGGAPKDGRLAAWKRDLAALRAEALVEKNPLVDFDRLLFVKRNAYDANHYYTEHINSHWEPGGNLCLLDLKTRAVTALVPELTGGVFGRFDLSFDASRVCFGWKCAHQEGYRLYEIRLDPATGSRVGKLEQLTFPQENEAWLVKMYRARPHYHHGTDDMHPCYLPDGDICFISTRCRYGILCDGPDDFTTTVLYRRDRETGALTRLTNSSVSEEAPVMLPDGRIMYTRWEYVDKGAVSVKCLWSMRQDGSASAEVYANDISLPPTFTYGRPIPGTANRYVCCGVPHYPQNAVGTVIRLDMTKAIRTREPMTCITPRTDIRGEGGFAFRDDPAAGRWRRDGKGRGRLFKDPYPLSDKLFLVSHKPAGPSWKDEAAWDLYFLGEGGRVFPLYRDPDISCFLPYPFRKRTKPPVLTSPREKKPAAENRAVCVVTDIYHGMEDVARGTIKYIRILEQVPRPWEARRRWGGDTYDQQHACISKDTHLGLKVQHGVVPVEKDGSAHFYVPAMKNIFFQALDENYLAVQTERTYVNYMPGEQRSCIGCHETPDDVTKSAKTRTPGRLLALQRAPSAAGPQVGEKTGGRPLHYPADVQPVLDKHCVTCHSGDNPKGKLDLSGIKTTLFNVSYEKLVRERRRGNGRRRYPLMVTIGENHPKTGNVHYLPARSLGSHSSILVAMLAPGKVTLKDPEQAKIAAKLAKKHAKVNRQMTPAELLKITNWVDTNAQYYGSYWGRRNLEYKGHPNFRPEPTYEQALSRYSPIPEERR